MEPSVTPQASQESTGSAESAQADEELKREQEDLKLELHALIDAAFAYGPIDSACVSYQQLHAQLVQYGGKEPHGWRWLQDYPELSLQRILVAVRGGIPPQAADMRAL